MKKCMITVLAMLPNMALAHQPAAVDVLGLRIGSPMPECGSSPAGQICGVEESLPRNVPALGMTRFSVSLAPDRSPDFVKYRKLFATVIDGNVEAITVFTTGPKSESDVMRQLAQKFAAPTNSEPMTAQNRLGAKFQYIQAHWLRGDVDVKFASMFDDINTGLISVTSEKAKVKYEEQGRAKASTGPHL